MTPPARAARLERIVGVVLRLGVGASTVCLGAGLTLSFVPGLSAQAAVLLHAGIVVLLVTPVARVVVSAGEYARQRDWLFVGLTLTVLLELLGGAVAALVFNRRL